MEHKQFPPLFCIRQYLYHTMYAVLTGQCKVPTSTGLESGGNRAPCGRQGLHHHGRREPERDSAFCRSCSRFVSQVLAAVRERTINYVQVNYPTLSSRTVSLTTVCTYLRMYVHILQCSVGDKGQPVLKLLRKIEVPFEIMAFQVQQTTAQYI